jgi:hypothetical protein
MALIELPPARGRDIVLWIESWELRGTLFGALKAMTLTGLEAYAGVSRSGIKV